MGNLSPSNKTRNRNSYSFDSGNFTNFKQDKILPSNNLSQSKYPSLKLNISSLDIQQTLKKYENIYDQNQNQGYNKIKMKEQNIKLQKLTKNNDELRKQLMEINNKLSEQLKKKKNPILLVQHNNKNSNKSKSLTKSSNQLNQSKQEDKKNKMKTAGLKKQLQNAYSQCKRYQKQIQQYKKQQNNKKNQLKITQYQDKIHQMDIQITQKSKQLQSLKSILLKQNKIIQQTQQQLNSKQIVNYKKQILELKEKLKILKQVSKKKEKDEKMRHETLLQLERKLRSINGQYLPQLINYSLKQNQQQQNKHNNNNNNKLKQSNIKLLKSSKNNNSSQFRYLPSNLQIQQIQTQLKKYKQQHQQYHKKINSTLNKKNELKHQQQLFNEKYKQLQKKYENLLYKKQRYTQLIMENIQEIGGSIQEQLSINQQNDENSLNMGQKVVKQFGDQLIQQKLYDDSELFLSKNYKSQQFKIITVNVWLNHKNQIVSLQFYYSNEKQFIVGHKIGQNTNFQQKRILELEQNDYLKNIMGIFNKKNHFIQFLVMESNKGKIFKYGKEILKGQNFNFKVNKKNKLTYFKGSTTFDGNYWRINKIGFQISNIN